MGQFTIVVADGDWATSRLIKYNLENREIRVLQASSGLECLKLVSGGRADLLLLDLDLPDFNGWGIMGLLRFTPFLANVPVIMTSVKTPDQDLMQQFQPADYIQKPFDVRDLVNRVRKIIEQSNGDSGKLARVS